MFLNQHHFWFCHISLLLKYLCSSSPRVSDRSSGRTLYMSPFSSLCFWPSCNRGFNQLKQKKTNHFHLAEKNTNHCDLEKTYLSWLWMSELFVLNELFGETVFLVMDLEDLLKLMLFTHQISATVPEEHLKLQCKFTGIQLLELTSKWWWSVYE